MLQPIVTPQMMLSDNIPSL
jgi:hypothetical protein